MKKNYVNSGAELRQFAASCRKLRQAATSLRKQQQFMQPVRPASKPQQRDDGGDPYERRTVRLSVPCCVVSGPL